MQTGRERAMVSEAKDPFDVTPTGAATVPPSQRPDTAFRQMYPTDSGIVMIDDLGPMVSVRLRRRLCVTTELVSWR